MASAPLIVNAFTAHGQHGNPAGIVLGAEDLDEQAMLAIAARVGLSETAFVSASDKATRRVRFFTPTTEVPLCGHATIATWSLLYQRGEVPAGTYTQETGAGILQIQINSDGLVFMEQAPAMFYEEVDPAEIARLLGLVSTDFSSMLRPQIVSTGIRDLVVPVGSKQVLSKIQHDLAGIAEFSRQHEIGGFHVFARLQDKPSIAAARNFAPADGIPEESATGTSNGALLCYFKNQNMLPIANTYRIEQGEDMGQLSYIYGTFRDNAIWIGGEAAVADGD